MSCNFFLVQPRMWDWGQPSNSHCCKHRYINSEESDTERFTYTRWGSLQGCYPTITSGWHLYLLMLKRAAPYWPIHPHSSHSARPTAVSQASPGNDSIRKQVLYYLFVFSLNIGWLPSWCTCSDLASLTDALDIVNLLAYCNLKFSLALPVYHF